MNWGDILIYLGILIFISDSGVMKQSHWPDLGHGSKRMRNAAVGSCDWEWKIINAVQEARVLVQTVYSLRPAVASAKRKLFTVVKVVQCESRKAV
jgi:hypothetical protein